VRPQPEFTVDVRRAGESVVVVVPVGEIDLSTVEEVRSLLREHEHGTLVLDLRGVEFLDSSGLTMILEQHRRAEHNGYEFVLTRGPDRVQRLFDITGLMHRLTFLDEPPGAGSAV
jgi:anti-sigma B factor antagonist